MRHLPAAVLIAFASLLPASRANSRTWSIFPDHSGDAPTIQAGIDSAAAGDTVLAQAGTYSETIDFKGKAITVRGASGPGNTILDGTGTAMAVVTFQSGEGRESLVEGFTIRSGVHGVFINLAEPTIIGNIISGNMGPSGAGILCQGVSTRLWSPLIRENDIRENIASGIGGGIAILDEMVPEVLYNTILDNQAQQWGGGVYVYGSSSGSDTGTVLQHNVIDSNVAGVQGGGIYVRGLGDSPLSIDIGFSVLIRNSALGGGPAAGGGIYLNNTNLVGHHLTVVKNTVQSALLGGGIVFDGPGAPRLEKSIIAFNTAGGGIACTGGATPIIHYCIGWLNTGGNGTGSCSAWDQTNGNLVADPLFCNLDEGDVTVAADSPAMFPPGGPMGAYITPGCSATPVRPATWGSLKARFGH
jgi:hypothetical protein